MHVVIMIGSMGTAGAWRRPGNWIDQFSFEKYTQLGKWAESGKIDALFVADTVELAPSQVKSGGPVGKPEPLTLLSALSAVTERVGLIGTASTTFSEPYNVARQFASLDLLSKGRAGWNIVTSVGGARNFGPERLTDHEQRYVRADEHVRIVKDLWDSWRDDAVVLDKANGIYANADAIRPIGFRGEHFQVEGPLNLPRPPQGRPVLIQAGASETGRQFAATHAEVIFISNQNLEYLQQFYADMKRRVREIGRNPEQVKILTGVSPIIAATETKALTLRDELADLVNYNEAIPSLEVTLGISLAGLGLDSGIPPELLPSEALGGMGQGQYGNYRKLALEEKLTIRELLRVRATSRAGHWTPVGTPEQLADQLEARLKARACDGFVFNPPYMPEGFELLINGVLPILRTRGLFRSDYNGATLRDHFGLPRPTPREF